ncbi:MAG: CofH family radical SAM protein, partial [Desulfovibrionaceae bacterium]|nr:CofH family radical SAM protein [Desulfovibrionaceae bacterium]
MNSVDKKRFENLGLGRVLDKVLSGERLDLAEGERLLACPDPLAVGALADHCRRRINGRAAFYVLNQHVNYSNVCVNGCAFCAFQRREGQSGAFVLSVDQILDKISRNPFRPREIHIVGGCHPTLGLAHFVEILRRIRLALPAATLKCFTAVEIAHFAHIEGLDTEEVLKTLKQAGLDMLPGGGAEIFDPEVRAKICPKKIDAASWLRIHGQAHDLGIRTNCTMLFGHLERPRHRIEHLDLLRRQQDASKGFVCFIPLPFQTENSRLKVEQPLTGLEELKTIAVSRLMLDNIAHIKAYWVMLTVKQAQAALFF